MRPSRGISSLPSPSSVTSGSPLSAGATCSSFQRSSAARRAVEPGPEVGRRRRRLHHEPQRGSATRDTSARIASTVGSTRIGTVVIRSTAAVSFRPWPVRTQTTEASRLELDLLEPGEARGRGRLAEDPLVACEVAPHSRDVVVGDSDGLDAAVGDERLDLGEMGGLGDPDRRGHRRRALGGVRGDDARSAARSSSSPLA